MSHNPFSLDGKTVLVTGASSGIGRQTAIECSKMGAKLIITARSKVRLLETYQALANDGHESILADISDEEQIERLVNSINAIDGLVLNAGINPKSLVKFASSELINSVLSTNLIGPILLTQRLLKKKKLKREASIVFMSSIATTYASISNSVYSASKGAINSFLRVLALEVAPQKIRVNGIQPGLIRTAMMDSYALQDDLAAWEKTYPLGRFGTTSDVAFSCIYLLSDATSWMTGSMLTIDGGVSLR